MHWYVNVENQAYGPYSDEQMRGFVAEGRITTSSLIANSLEAGFYGATEFDAFNLWSGDVQQSMLIPLVAAGAGTVQATTASYAPIQPVQTQRAQQPIQTAAQTYTPPVAPITPDVYSPEVQAPKIQNSKSCVFLIMAEINSSGEMAFLQALQGFGHAERVGDTVWLVRTSHSVEQIRNTLSQALNQQDRLFIMNSKAGKTAWFNIGTDLDNRIRELWDEDAG